MPVPAMSYGRSTPRAPAAASFTGNGARGIGPRGDNQPIFPGGPYAYGLKGAGTASGSTIYADPSKFTTFNGTTTPVSFGALRNGVGATSGPAAGRVAGAAGGGAYAGYAGAAGGSVPRALQAAQDAANADNEARYQQGLTRIQTGGQEQLDSLNAGYAGLLGQVGNLSNVDETRANRATTQELASQTARFYGMGLANTTGAVMARQGIIDRGTERAQLAGDQATRLGIQLGENQIRGQQSDMQGSRGEETQWIKDKTVVGPDGNAWANLLSQAGAGGGRAGGAYAGYAGPGNGGIGGNDAQGSPGVNGASYGLGGARGAAPVALSPAPGQSTYTPDFGGGSAPFDFDGEGDPAYDPNAGAADDYGGSDSSAYASAYATPAPRPGGYDAGHADPNLAPLPGRPNVRIRNGVREMWDEQYQRWMPN